MCTNWTKFLNSVILLQIIFTYAITSFMCNRLLSKNCSVHLSVSLRFCSRWSTFSSTLQRWHQHLSFCLCFQVPNINHMNLILSLYYIDLYVFFSPILVSYSSVRHHIHFLSFSVCLWISFLLFVWARSICSTCTAACRLIVLTLYYPSVLDVPTFAASPSPRPCNPRDS